MDAIVVIPLCERTRQNVFTIGVGNGRAIICIRAVRSSFALVSIMDVKRLQIGQEVVDSCVFARTCLNGRLDRIGMCMFREVLGGPFVRFLDL